MSLEQFLLIALLVVLPLIQHVMQLARKGNKLPEQAKGLPPRMKGPAVPEQQPALPREAHPAASGATIAPVEYTNPRVGPTAARRAQRSAVVTSLGNPFDARRAIVLLTLIGPCRAARPHGWQENERH